MDTWRAVQKVLCHKMIVVDKGKTLKKIEKKAAQAPDQAPDQAPASLCRLPRPGPDQAPASFHARATRSKDYSLK